MGARTRYTGHPYAEGTQLRSVASEEAARPALHHLIARQPHRPPVIGVPVLLLVTHIHHQLRGLHLTQPTSRAR